MRPSLPKSEILKAIEHRSPSRVPMIFHHYTPLRMYGGNNPELLKLLGEYPTDVYFHIAHMPPIYAEAWTPKGYSWVRQPPPADTGQVALDAEVAISDWSQLDEFLSHLPDPNVRRSSRGPRRTPTRSATATPACTGGTACMSARGNCAGWRTS